MAAGVATVDLVIVDSLRGGGFAVYGHQSLVPCLL